MGKKNLKRLASWLLANNRLYPLTASLLLLTIFLTLCILSAAFFPQVKSSLFGVLLERLGPILLWLIATLIQVVAYLLFSFYKVHKAQGFFSPSNWRLVVLGTLLVIAFGQILILYLPLPTFRAIPYWFWQYLERTIIHPEGLVWLLLVLVSSIFYIFRKPNQIRVNLLILILMGYSLIVGFGFIEGEGFRSLQRKHLSANYVDGYSEWAAQKWMTPLLITEYEERFSRDFLLGTKPPGVLLCYSIVQKVSNVIYPAKNFNGRQFRMTKFISIVFPLLTFAVLPVIGVVARM